ncbi:LADA_0A03510g1_1 [Lachancea dasiensis]|uniref:LADA_0A03510g1_1 n=1 Tax=Lachancea dasiensis TaxID=1072105 RepID=A0A1G4IN01_9SACH|nr:LADA_0A03510g1_1 [Lachancea dasiensis]
MHTGTLLQQGSFQELQNFTVLPRIKIAQKGSKIRPSLPSIRQLLQDIHLRHVDFKYPNPDLLHGKSSRHIAQTPELPSGGRVISEHLASGTETPSHDFDSSYTTISEISQRRLANIGGGNTRLVQFHQHRSTPRPLGSGKILKPSGDLLKLAYAVEASTKAGRHTITSNRAVDSIIHFNGDYQLKIAEILESLQIMYKNFQEWPLSLHSQDVAATDSMCLLIDYISADSLELTLKMAKRAYDSLKMLEQWKRKYKKLHLRLPLNPAEKLPQQKRSSNLSDLSESHGTLPKLNPMVDAIPEGRKDYRTSDDSSARDHQRMYDQSGTGVSTLSQSSLPEGGIKKIGVQCAHCHSAKTPEWRKGPHGKRSLCNACGLFYKKLVRKFGDERAAMILKYRKKISSADRKVPKLFDVPVTGL